MTATPLRPEHVPGTLPAPAAPSSGAPEVTSTRVLRSRTTALELLGAYTADLPVADRRRCLQRVVEEVSGSAADVEALLHALAEYAATFADVAARATAVEAEPDPAGLVRALARIDLRPF
ncbi:hypothetical protein [Motilibacter rhizosphaerae]|uniref:hypothetical protein n=1 Tax=Motilibacter rhizosphaerae TaxID=598652 RepID=UPI00102CA9CB|nr:hypothetical protein [Motilibacter rhizosphaerae]